MRVLLFLGGLSLVVWVVSRQDIPKLLQQVVSVQWGWYIVVLGWTLICHWMRALRWKMLLNEGGAELNTLTSYHCLMSGYFINFPTGKLGEAARCIFLNRKTGAEMGMSLGTVLVERVLDVLCLITVLLISYLMYFREIYQFVLEKMWDPLWSVLSSMPWWIWVLVVLSSLVFVVVFYLILKRRSKKITWLSGLGRGMQTVWNLRFNTWLWVYTLAIWVLYFLMTYTWFFGMNVPGLGAKPGLALLVIGLGGIGRSLPVPGHGLGSYHFFAMSALLFGGVSSTEAVMIPIVIHGGEGVGCAVFDYGITDFVSYVLS